MKIILCYKLTPDPQTIQASPGGPVSLDRADWVPGDFDLVAEEAAAQLAEKTGAVLVGLSVGTSRLENTRTRKNVLSRGCDELYLVQDDSLLHADSHETACLLAEAVRVIGEYDLIVCGEGSNDLYFQQVGLQLGELLGVPTINAISELKGIENGKLTARRTTETSVDELEIPLPAVICVTAEICQTRIPRMQEILKAGKKPVHEIPLSQFQNVPAATAPVSILAPQETSRQADRIDGTPEEMADALVRHLQKDGVI